MELSPDQARDWLIGHCGLRAPVHPGTPEGTRALLHTRRCIQLDPLDRIGTNADLVAMARLDVGRGDIYQHVAGHAFEHFAKERCLLPASAFAAYRDRAVETPWWRHTERMRRLADHGEHILEAVLAEVRERGPIRADQLEQHGRLEAIDWSGWKGTTRATTLALRILWVRCEVVVSARQGRHKLYDVPERALGPIAQAPAPADFARWALLERVEAAGFLSRNSGPWWSMLSEARTSPLPDQLVEEGAVVEVTIAGRRYLAPADFAERTHPEDDGRMRILGPLDPLIWNRRLVRDVFDFDYVWEVYKPKNKRQWGYYVCPLLHHGKLVGRFEGHVEDGRLVVDTLWREGDFDDRAFDAAIARHQAAI